MVVLVSAMGSQKLSVVRDNVLTKSAQGCQE